MDILLSTLTLLIRKSARLVPTHAKSALHLFATGSSPPAECNITNLHAERASTTSSPLLMVPTCRPSMLSLNDDHFFVCPRNSRSQGGRQTHAKSSIHSTCWITARPDFSPRGILRLHAVGISVAAGAGDAEINTGGCSSEEKVPPCWRKRKRKTCISEQSCHKRERIDVCC